VKCRVKDRDDKRLCVKLLKNVEQKFSASFQEHKAKKFDDIYDAVVGKNVE
jgi:hypothetical protein